MAEAKAKAWAMANPEAKAKAKAKAKEHEFRYVPQLPSHSMGAMSLVVWPVCLLCNCIWHIARHANVTISTGTR